VRSKLQFSDWRLLARFHSERPITCFPRNDSERPQSQRDHFHSKVLKRIVLDIDDTFDAVHGGQQLRLFNPHYHECGFQPIVVFGSEGRVITAVLRRAKLPSGKEIKSFLHRLLLAIRAKWPKTRFLVRAVRATATLRTRGSRPADAGLCTDVGNHRGTGRCDHVSSAAMNVSKGGIADVHRHARCRLRRNPKTFESSRTSAYKTAASHQKVGALVFGTRLKASILMTPAHRAEPWPPSDRACRSLR
jgi:hypothetical protein